ncbi:MAG: hypothetical protein GXP45_01655 [bacterium]|nr:hypothetical protein [bacterium]
MYITKSLFVEFNSNPKLARRHIHDKNTYKAIQEDMYGAMDGIAVGKATEDKVLDLYKNKQVVQVDTHDINFSDWHNSYYKLTQKVLSEMPELLYQGGFLLKDLFVKSDLLFLNEDNKYDLIEVKSKNNIRKKNKDEELLDDLMADLSFQHYVLKHLL